MDKEQLIKLLKSALIAGAGAGIVYLSENIGQLNFGVYTPLAAAGFAWAINLIKVFLKK